MTSKAIIWAALSEFVSSRIPSWQISTAHAQPFRGARDASSEGSGDKYQILELIWYSKYLDEITVMIQSFRTDRAGQTV